MASAIMGVPVLDFLAEGAPSLLRELGVESWMDLKFTTRDELAQALTDKGIGQADGEGIGQGLGSLSFSP